MAIIKLPTSTKLIPIDMFNTCLEDNLTRSDISSLYTKYQVTTHKSCYFLDKFAFHIKTKFNLTLREYCQKYLIEEWPRCPINNELLGFKIDGKGINISTFNGSVTKEFSPKFKEACDRFSEERKGEGNPMFGKVAWNTGLDNSDPRVLAVANKRRGTKVSEETKEKQREARANHPLKIRHNTPHTIETVEKLRENTARLWAEGKFNRISSIHLKMREFLFTLDLNHKWEEEYQVKYFSLDFAFPDIKVGVEVQGGFFHVDPRLYPDGPICAIQRRNFGRDKAKRKVVCDQEGWAIIEVWETEINDGSFKQDLLNKLFELNICNYRELKLSNPLG